MLTLPCRHQKISILTALVFSLNILINSKLGKITSSMILKMARTAFSTGLMFFPLWNDVCAEEVQENLSGNTAFEISPRWKSRPLGNKDFYIVSLKQTHDTVIQTEEGKKLFKDEAFVREGVHMVRPVNITNEYYQQLIKSENPVIISALRPNEMDINALKFMKNNLEKRFIGIIRVEWFHNRYMNMWPGCDESNAACRKKIETACKQYNLPFPQNKDEAFAFFASDYLFNFGRMQNAGIPVFPFTEVFLNHWECRMGASVTGAEIGGYQECSPMQIAFSRGASRQYDIPWAIYIACWGLGVKGQSVTRYYMLRPDERTYYEGDGINSFKWDEGPYSGTSLSLQKRLLYMSYMAGANMIQKEDDNVIFFANYDEFSVDRIDPRVIALQEKVKYLSPLGRIYKEFYDNIVKRHQRGIAYTPVALLLDKNHGCIMKYSNEYTVAQVPYRKGDYQTRAIINTLFPWEDRRRQTGTFEANTNVTGPFGDIFDVLTNDTPEEAISSYKAICLSGEVRIDKKFEGILKDYVKNGGILLMCTEQMPASFWNFAGIADTGPICKDTGAIVCRNNYRINETKEFKFRRVIPLTALPLIKSLKMRYPLATVNKVGKGKVIVFTPEWIMESESKNKMLNLFSYMLSEIKNELVPVRVYGNVQVLYCKTPDSWVITLINNNGVYKYPGEKEVVRKEEAAPVILKPGFKWSNAKEWITSSSLSELSVLVPPGDVRIVEISNN